MSTTNNNNTSTSLNNNSSASCFAVKMRRLKIEESILLQNLSKITSCTEVSEMEQYNYLTFESFKKFSSTTRNSYKELKQLFQDIKERTSSKEMLQALDIDEIKKCIHELDRKIKSFKSTLHRELDDLKSTERHLNQTLNDPVLINNLKKQSRIHTAKYAEIVPSPVKTMMTSPFRCAEVQEFQEFMKSSKNRYGGWDEYHHNIFVNFWLKYFDTNGDIENKNENLKNVEESSEFDIFLEELTPKLLGISEKEVRLHVKWFVKYLHLKDRQQKAIEKWRTNRRMIQPHKTSKEPERIQRAERGLIKAKQSSFSTNLTQQNITDYLEPQNDQILSKDKPCKYIRKCLRDEMGDSNDENDVNKNSLKFMKPTKQSNIRRTSKSVETCGTFTQINGLESIKKLGIPFWRTGLSNVHRDNEP